MKRILAALAACAAVLAAGCSPISQGSSFRAMGAGIPQDTSIPGVTEVIVRFTLERPETLTDDCDLDVSLLVSLAEGAPSVSAKIEAFDAVEVDGEVPWRLRSGAEMPLESPQDGARVTIEDFLACNGSVAQGEARFLIEATALEAGDASTTILWNPNARLAYAPGTYVPMDDHVIRIERRDENGEWVIVETSEIRHTEEPTQPWPDPAAD